MVEIGVDFIYFNLKCITLFGREVRDILSGEVEERH
jgi:hypothetical protein